MQTLKHRVWIYPDGTWQAVWINTYTAKTVVVEAPDFPKRFRKCVRDSGIGIRPLAKKSGLDKSTIQAWLKKAEIDPRNRGPIRVYVEKAERVAPHLGTTAEYLLGLPPGVQTPPPQADLIALLKRVAAMKPAIAELDVPTHDLAAALEGSQQEMSRLEAVLPQLLSLAEEAANASAPEQ